MNKRKKYFILTVLLIFFSGIILIDGTVSAATVRRRDEVKSKGIIDYGNGKVIINSSDLTSLADQTDELELSFKTAITDSLANIGTYMQQDGSINHDGEENIDPQRIKYSDLMTGISESQSVGHLADVQAADTKALIYYAREVNNILEVTHDNTQMPVLIAAVTEDNLTADTAGWINGECITGNGADNYYFYQKGYIEGYAAKLGATVEYTYDETGKVKSAKLILP